MAVRRKIIRTIQPSGPVPIDPYWLRRGLVLFDVGNGWIWTKAGGWQGPRSQVGPPKLWTTEEYGAVRGYGATYGVGTTDRTDGPLLDSTSGYRSIVTFSYANGYGGGGFGRIFQPAGHPGNDPGDEAWYISSTSSFKIIYAKTANTSGGAWCISGAPVLGQWMCYGMSHDQRTVGTTPALYENGVLATTTVVGASVGAYVEVARNLEFGNRSTTGDRVWDGMLGPKLIFMSPDSALTAVEHASLRLNPYQVALQAPRRAAASAAVLRPPLFSNTNTIYVPAVDPGTIRPPLITNSSAIYAPGVNQTYLFDDHERSNADLTLSSVTQDNYAPTVYIYPRLHLSDAYGNAAYEFFHARVTGVLGKRPNFKVRYYLTPGTHALDAWGFQSTQRFMYSYDQVTWNYFDTHAQSGDNLNIDFKLNSDFTGNTVYVASQRPYTSTMVGAFVASLASTYSSYVSMPSSSAGNAHVIDQVSTQTDERGRVIPAQNIYSVRITDDTQHPDDGSPKRIVVLIAGQHASEDCGNWMIQGAMEFLVSSDAKAVTARKNFEFLIYPHINVMGRYGGHWRGDFNSAHPTYDGNRRWLASPDMENVTKNKAAITTDIAGRQIAAWLDYHGGYSGWFIYSGSTLYSQYLTKLLTYQAGVTTFDTNPVSSSTYYAANTLGADLATPVESSRDLQLTEAQIKAHGASSLKSIVDLFADGDFPYLVPSLVTNTSTIFAPNMSGVLSALAGTTATASASLSVGKPLAATLTAVASLTGGLEGRKVRVYFLEVQASTGSSTKNLDAEPSGASTLSAAMGLGVPLAAAPQEVSTLSAAMFLSVGLASAASSIATVTAALSHAVPLAANAVSVATAVAALNQQVQLLAAASGTSVVGTASLLVGKPLAADLQAVASLSASVGQSVPLAASLVSVSTVAADVSTSGGITLASAAQAQATVIATLAQSVPLAANAVAVASVVAAINQPVTLVSAAVSVSNVGTATLSVGKPLSAQATSVASATSAMALSVPLSASLQSIATVTATMSATLAGNAQAQSTLTASLAVGVPLSASAGSESTLSPLLSIGKPLAATPTSVATVSATVSNSVTLAASAIAVATATASVNDALNLLASVGSVSTVTTATLAVGKPLAANIQSVSAVAADLSNGASTTCAATPVAESSLTASLAVGKALQADAIASSTASSAVTLATPLAAGIVSLSTVVADVNCAMQLGSSATASSTMTADILITKILVSAAQAQATATAAINSAKWMAAAITVESYVQADLNLAKSLAANAQALVTLLADLGFVGPTLARNFLNDVSHVQTMEQAVALSVQSIAIATTVLETIYATPSKDLVSHN